MAPLPLAFKLGGETTGPATILSPSTSFKTIYTHFGLAFNGEETRKTTRTIKEDANNSLSQTWHLNIATILSKIHAKILVAKMAVTFLLISCRDCSNTFFLSIISIEETQAFSVTIRYKLEDSSRKRCGATPPIGPEITEFAPMWSKIQYRDI